MNAVPHQFCAHPTRKNTLIREITRIHRALSSSKNQSPPSPLFEELIALTAPSDFTLAREILADPKITAIQHDLRIFCAAGETILELHTAQEIIKSADPWKTLKSFRYFANYQHLAALETGGLRLILPNPIKNALFIGSGPLPLSAILLALQGIHVTCIERDFRAAALSKKLIRRLELSKSISIQKKDLFGVHNFAFDAVILAALVGTTPSEKTRATAHIRTRAPPKTPLSSGPQKTFVNSSTPQFHSPPLKNFTTESSSSHLVKSSTASSSHTHEYRQKTPREIPRIPTDRATNTIPSRQTGTDLRLDEIRHSLNMDAYKYHAYKKTTPINTLADLQKHCSDKTHICNKRYHFLAAHIKKHHGLRLESRSHFPPLMRLTSLLNHPAITQLPTTTIQEWKRHEYYSKNGKTAKWENYRRKK